MKKHFFLFLMALFFLFFALSGSQQQQRLPPQEKHEVEVRLVLVDVIVTKGEEFVTDLTKDDFELYEDEKKVPINSFELISFAERKVVILEEEPEEEIPLEIPSKKLVVVVDGVNSWPRNLKRGAKKVVNELISLVKLGHEVMIIHMSGKKGVEILQPFTTEGTLIGKAIVKAAGNIWVEKSLDALKLAQDVGIEGAGEQAQVERSTGKSDQDAVLLEEYLYFAKQRFEYSIGEILAVFYMIKDLPGRKSVLLISDGFPDLSSKTLDSIVTQLTPWTGSKARSPHLDRRRTAGGTRIFDPFNIFNNKKFTGGEEVIRELIRFANAQNISIYTLDPGTFSEYFFTASAESFPQVTMFQKHEKIKQIQNLRWISEGTGAAWLRGAKKYERFRQAMKTDLNYYYQLSYYPRRDEPDNKYHKIKVKVKRSGVNIRFRKGYTDYSWDEEGKMLLITAFYNPKLYKALPFDAEFILFHKDSNRYEPWMNIALPVKELFIEKEVEYGLKKFDLHVWIKDKKRGERAFGGQINIPFKIDSSFMDALKTTDYLCFHYKGPELTFNQKECQAIFAIFDPQMNEVGTWESTVFIPDLEDEKQSAVLNCVLGFLTPNPKKGRQTFSVSQDDGSLEYGEIKFFPAVTNQFHRMQNASVFLQVFIPQGRIGISPRFEISGEGRFAQRIPEKLVAESWNKESKIWSGIFNLNLENVIFGDYILKAEIPVSEEGPALIKEVKLIKLRY
jgi:VWFA-related protein